MKLFRKQGKINLNIPYMGRLKIKIMQITHLLRIIIILLIVFRINIGLKKLLSGKVINMILLRQIEILIRVLVLILPNLLLINLKIISIDNMMDKNYLLFENFFFFFYFSSIFFSFFFCIKLFFNS